MENNGPKIFIYVITACLVAGISFIFPESADWADRYIGGNSGKTTAVTMEIYTDLPVRTFFRCDFLGEKQKGSGKEPLKVRFTGNGTLLLDFAFQEKTSLKRKIVFWGGQPVLNAERGSREGLQFESWPGNNYKILSNRILHSKDSTVTAKPVSAPSRIDFNGDGLEEQVYLLKIAESLILKVQNKKMNQDFKALVKEIVKGPAEIQDIADINGDGYLELVILGEDLQSTLFIEMFTFKKMTLERIFAAEGLSRWSIGRTGKTIQTRKVYDDTAGHLQDNYYRWQKGKYYLIGQNTRTIRTKPELLPEDTAKAFMEAIAMEAFNEARGYLSKHSGLQEASGSIQKGWTELRILSKEIMGKDAVITVGALYPLEGENLLKGRIYRVKLSQDEKAGKGWLITAIK